MLDFPASPTNGQKFPQPAVTGVPVYTWDGEKWTTAGGEIVTATPATALPLINATPAVVGTTLKYAREDHVHPTDTTRTSVTDVNNIVKAYAAPFDAMAYSGMQINGGMEVSQENGANGIPVSNAIKYVVDQWRLMSGGAQTAGSSQIGGANVPPGFVNGIQGYCAVVNTSPAAGDHSALRTDIEGYRIAKLAWGTAQAQPITISFWVWASKTGTYSGAVKGGAGRSYVFTYTVNAINTHEYKTVTVPGDVAGTWVKDNTAGMMVVFALMMGSTLSTTPGAWVAGDFYGATGTQNIHTSTGDSIRFTGVTILPGTQAPTAAQSPNIMRPYDQELVTCQRYYYKKLIAFYGYGASGGNAGQWMFHNSMRVAPTLIPSAATYSNGSNLTVDMSRTEGFRFYVTMGVSGNVSADFTLAADARL